MNVLPYTLVPVGAWFLYDRKTLDFSVSSEAPLAGPYRFLLLTEPNGSVVMSKDGDDISIEDDLVKVSVGGANAEEAITEYAAVVAAYRMGVFFMELYDLTNGLKVAEGYAAIGMAKQEGIADVV